MTDSLTQIEPQCQYFVLRKKRLCRMTVRPGRQYCGEHEPQPKTADGQDDTRIPCPNDPKHTVYISKLEKHLLICNARAVEQPPYIVPNINAPTEEGTCLRKPLSQISRETIMHVIDKVNFLYDKHVKENITTVPEYPIHSSVMEEFSESNRTESSLRHLRQVSSLLWLAEEEGLVAANTCYVELGAGKGHVSYYACQAWCGADSSALLVDRASLRHKRDNKLRQRCAARLRADLAHLALHRVPLVARSHAVLGLAKHLCGVATDYALRCMTADGVLPKTRGVVLATCCHHRCQRAAFIANQHLQELGISSEEFNVMLGIVSWATCGDGRSRNSRTATDVEQLVAYAQEAQGVHAQGAHAQEAQGAHAQEAQGAHAQEAQGAHAQDAQGAHAQEAQGAHVQGAHEQEAQGAHAQEAQGAHAQDAQGAHAQEAQGAHVQGAHEQEAQGAHAQEAQGAHAQEAQGAHAQGAQGAHAQEAQGPQGAHAQGPQGALAPEGRARVGRRAKRLLDWARVLQLRAQGFQARLCYFVPPAVSPENVCIIAKKLS